MNFVRAIVYRPFRAAALGLVMFSLAGGLLGLRNPNRLDPDKLAPALRAELVRLSAEPFYDYPIPVIVRIEADAFRGLSSRAAGGRREGELSLVHSFSAKMTARQIRLLLRSNLVEYVTLDAVIRPHVQGGGLQLTDYVAAIGGDQTPSDGNGAVIALFDSGLSPHNDLPKARILAAMDFTNGGEGKTSNDDGYGHGTHVAGIIGGDGASQSGRVHAGLAKGAKFVSLKVIGDEGWGYTSDLIRAIDWTIANRAKYKINIANMSLGHPPVESYQSDPLCAAVRRLVESGVVTVVSAGNLGKTAEYPKVGQSIASPGTEPSVITVSALNNRGTLTLRDDIATTFSSRGPTLDGVFKPDLTAPGNSIPSLDVSGSYINGHYPQYQVGDAYISLSGSSMATAFVTGAVAQMLQMNREMSPRLAKAILLVSAVKLDLPSMTEQGNGLVNVKVAFELAKYLDTNERRLKASIPPSWNLCDESGVCETVTAGGAFATGASLLHSAAWNAPGDLYWGNGRGLRSVDPSAVFWVEDFFTPISDVWSVGPSDGFGSDGVFWADGMFWANSLLRADGVFWAEGQFSADGVFWANGTFWAESELGTDTDFAPDPD